MEEKDRVSSISHSRSLEEMAEFWDTHDATDFKDQTYEVDMTFDLRSRRHYAAVQTGTAAQVQITLSPEDLAGIQQKASQAGIPYQELIALIVHHFVAGQ